MSDTYPKPPIAEGLIEIRFQPDLPDKALRRLMDSGKKRYSRVEEQVEIEFNFDLEAGKNATKQQFSGARCLSDDGADITIFSKGSLTVTRLAPYMGWPALKERAERELEEVRSVAPDRRFTRLGVRYVNRIDVPIENGQFSPEPYLTVFPMRPPILAGGPAQAFAVSIGGCKVGDYFVNVNTGIAPPQLIGHAALLVDIDTYIEADMDARSLAEKLEGVRVTKNAVFEGLITDKARGLFA